MFPPGSELRTEPFPIPASNGTLQANAALARRIADLVPGARVKLAVARSSPVESSCARRRRTLPGLTPDEHHIVRIAGPMLPLPVFFVDNVITTGSTLRAARAALGWGDALTYADASSCRTVGSPGFSRSPSTCHTP